MKTNKETEKRIIKSIKEDNAAELETIIKSGYDFNKKLSGYRHAIFVIPGSMEPSNPTPLGLAARYNAVHCLKLLLALPGININKTDDKHKVTPLYTAAMEGYAECVKLLLSAKGINVNKAVRGNESPLIVAARFNQAECLQLLLNTPDIKVNKKARYRFDDKIISFTALDRAIYNRSDSECIQALLAHPKINTKHIPGTILAVVKNSPDELQRLIDEGADVNKRDKLGFTALHHAVLTNNPTCVEILLQAPDVTPNLDNNLDNATAIEEASGLGYTECLKRLLASDKVKRDANTLYMAAANDEAKCEEILLKDKQIATSYSPAQLAVCHNDVAALRKAINDGTDVNTTLDSTGQTLLHQAAYNERRHDCLQLLLNEAKINPNSTDKWGLTPLHYAAHNNAYHNVETLLKHPATELNKAANNGFTPLDACNNAPWDALRYNCRDILKQHGAQRRKWHYLFTRPWSVGCIWLGAALGLLGTCHYSDKHDDLSKVIIYAAQKGDIDTLAHLVHAGADLDYAQEALWAAYNNINDSENAKDCFFFLLSDSGVDPNTAQINGWTLLHAAAANGQTEIVESLLATPNIDVNLTDKEGYPPLRYAAQNGHKDCVDLLLKAPGLDYSLWNAPEWAVINNDTDSLYRLVNANATDYATALHYATALGYTQCLQALLTATNIDVNAKNQCGNTALHIAIEQGREECAKLLLAHKNIDVNACDHGGNTPLHIAIEQGQEEYVKLLLAHPNIRVGKISKFISSSNTACVLAALAHPTAERATYPQALIAVRTNNHAELQNLIETGEFDKMLKGQKLNALYHASRFGHTECVKVLLQAPFYASEEGISHRALYRAALHGQKECVQALLEDPAIEVNCLSDIGGYIDSETKETGSECLQLIISSPKFDVKKSFPHIFKALACYKDAKNLKRLLSMPGADYTVRLYDEQTILHVLVANFDDADLVKELLSKPGINVNAQDKYGNTPLHKAVYKGHSKAVTALLSAPGIDVNIKNKDGHTPLDKNRNQHMLIHTHLRRAGAETTR